MFLSGNLMLKRRHLSDVGQTYCKVSLSRSMWVLLHLDGVSKPGKCENRMQEEKAFRVWSHLDVFSAKLPKRSDLLVYLNF